ncbi:hypothetical protein GOP47_0026739 [Adiantum capillus-veneris]|nr:hypothetical protein GOP47_0026739 [Adiantum capillus-veneris]
MERWRSYFAKSEADIWTVIQQAINIAAIDFPMDFRERRGEIAETLFARNLSTMHAKPISHDSKLITSEADELRESDGRPWPMAKQPCHNHPNEDATLVTHSVIHASDDDGARAVCHSNHQDAEAFSAEQEKDALLIRDINGIKKSITSGDQAENVVVEALQRLQYMQITVGALKATEIGKHVKVLKKHPSKMVRALVKDLVRDWKILVDEWATGATIGPTTAVETGSGDSPKAPNEGDRLPSPPLNESVHPEAGALSVDLSKLFSFIDEEICTEGKDGNGHLSCVEPSVKDNSNYLSRSLSGSMLTDSSDFDTKASTNHPWGHRTPEERGSATRDVYPPSGNLGKEQLSLKGQTSQREKGHRGMNNEWGLQAAKGMANSTNQGRQCIEASKVKPTADGKRASKHDAVNRTHIAQRAVAINASIADKSCLLKHERNEVDQKLEIAKRKLHQGYQQAETAKKQRTVQVLDFQEGVKAGQLVKGKSNPAVQMKGIPPAQNRVGFQNSHGSQNRRVA